MSSPAGSTFTSDNKKVKRCMGIEKRVKMTQKMGCVTLVQVSVLNLCYDVAVEIFFNVYLLILQSLFPDLWTGDSRILSLEISYQKIENLNKYNNLNSSQLWIDLFN